MSDRLYNYSLPRDRIAQQPIGRGADRATARLLVARRAPILKIRNAQVRDLPEYLRAGDLLVMNNSRVIPSRFFFTHGSSEMEVLLLRRFDGEQWEALARPMRRAREGETLKLSPRLEARVLGRTRDETRLQLQLASTDAGTSVIEVIREDGTMPIPGYIRDGRAGHEDRELYQTVFAKTEGSVAAPTAGLHLTPDLLDQIRRRGVRTAEVTLHVGPASFLPVRDMDNHEMPSEPFSVPHETQALLDETRSQGGRIVAVGTTSARTLESFVRLERAPAGDEFVETNLFVKPGFEFRAVDMLMTNFHQPGTTHLLLVAAFFGEDQMADIYEHALQGEYRFLSYGDAMLLQNT